MTAGQIGKTAQHEDRRKRTSARVGRTATRSAPAGARSPGAGEERAGVAEAVPYPMLVRETAAGLAIVTVAMTGLSPDDYEQCYSRTVSGLLETRVSTPEPRAVLHGLFLGRVNLTFGDHTPHVTRRTRRAFARDQADSIAMFLTRAGKWRASARGRKGLEGGAGSISMFDLTQEFSITLEEDQSFIGVLIPRDMAEGMADDPAELHGRMLEPGAAGPLAGMLAGLVDHASSLRADQGPALAGMLVELATLALRPNGRTVAGKRTPDRLLRERVERIVMLNLNARTLTPAWVADKLGVSRTQLYAAFPKGGVAKLIWERRLTAAHAALTDPDEDRTIAAIAGMFGFASDAHFSRAFSKQYGMSPSAARRAAREE